MNTFFLIRAINLQTLISLGASKEDALQVKLA